MKTEFKRPVSSKAVVEFFERIGLHRTDVTYAKLDALDDLLIAALAAEREACAKMAENYSLYLGKISIDNGSDAAMKASIVAAERIATLIRGRGET